MSKILEYRLVRNPDIIVFQKYVEENLRNGFQLYGDLIIVPLKENITVEYEGLPSFTCETMFHQAMVKYEEPQKYKLPPELAQVRVGDM